MLKAQTVTTGLKQMRINLIKESIKDMGFAMILGDENAVVLILIFPKILEKLLVAILPGGGVLKSIRVPVAREVVKG